MAGSKLPEGELAFMYFPDNYRWSHGMLGALSTAPWGGAEIDEVHRIGLRIKDHLGDDQVWFREWTGEAEKGEDLFDIYLPLVRHEVQPAIGLALRKEVLFRRGAIKSPKQRAPGSSLTAFDKAELDGMINRLERRLAASGHGHKMAAE